MVGILDGIFNQFYPGIHIPILCLSFKHLTEILYFCNYYNCRVFRKIIHSLFPILDILSMVRE